MASAILHIKDSYYFEVPKFLWRSDRKSMDDFPPVWIRLDPDYQEWEAGRIYEFLQESELIDDATLPKKESLIHQWQHWQHQGNNFAKPFDVYLESSPETDWKPIRRSRNGQGLSSNPTIYRSTKRPFKRANGTGGPRKSWTTIATNWTARFSFPSCPSQ